LVLEAPAGGIARTNDADLDIKRLKSGKGINRVRWKKTAQKTLTVKNVNRNLKNSFFETEEGCDWKGGWQRLTKEKISSTTGWT